MGKMFVCLMDGEEGRKRDARSGGREAVFEESAAVDR